MWTFIDYVRFATPLKPDSAKMNTLDDDDKDCQILDHEGEAHWF